MKQMKPWVPRPILAPGDELLWERNANRAQGSTRQVGGKLFLTRTRIIFVPNRVDNATGGQLWICDLTNIVEIGIAARNATAMFRRRLRIVTAAGEIELFIINGVNTAVRKLQRAVEDATSQSS